MCIRDRFATRVPQSAICSPHSAIRNPQPPGGNSVTSCPIPPNYRCTKGLFFVLLPVCPSRHAA
eukprot:41552-Alexandrium_andersonii.AAC.1